MNKEYQKHSDRNTNLQRKLKQVHQQLRNLLNSIPAVAEFKLLYINKIFSTPELDISEFFLPLDTPAELVSKEEKCPYWETTRSLEHNTFWGQPERNTQRLQKIVATYKSFKIKPSFTTEREHEKAKKELQKGFWGELWFQPDTLLFCLAYLQGIADKPSSFDEMQHWITHQAFADSLEQARELVDQEGQILAQLVKHNATLIESIALKFQPTHHLTHDDVVQLGIDAIKYAAYQADEDSPYHFTSFAYLAITRHIRDRLQEAEALAGETRTRELDLLDRRIQYIAEHCGITGPQAIEFIRRLNPDITKSLKEIFATAEVNLLS